MAQNRKSYVRVWVPCRVTSGPFSHERRVLIEENTEENWFGFVGESLLEDSRVQEGATRVSALVLSYDRALEVLECCIPNAGIAGNIFHMHKSQVELIE